MGHSKWIVLITLKVHFLRMLETLDNVPMWKHHGANEPKVSPPTTYAERLWNPFISKSTKFSSSFIYAYILSFISNCSRSSRTNQSPSQMILNLPKHLWLPTMKLAAEARFDSASVSGCLNYKGKSVPYMINRF